MRDDFAPANLGNAAINYDPNAYNRIIKNVELLFNALRQPGPINVTTITTSGNITIGGDAEIDGDLTVNGTINGGGGPWLPLAGGTMDSGAVIAFDGPGTDRVHWYSNTYGTGIETGTLTNWAGTQHRWRIGGTSVTAGTEYMLLSSTALTLTGNLSVSGTSIFSDAVSIPNAGTSTGLSLGSGTNETRVGNQGIFAREGGTIIFRPNGSGSSSNQATLNTSGTLAAVLFSGSGASLTSLNASNLSSGTVPDGRFPATLPAASGANLTNLNASNLSSGTVPSARVSGSYTGINGLGDLTATDLLVLKSNAIIGTGISGVTNGGMANLTSSGVGSACLFAESGTIYFRPNGRTSSTNQATLDTSGILALAGGSPAFTISSGSVQTQIASSGIFARNGGPVYLRPNGVGDSTGQAILNTSGVFTADRVDTALLNVTSSSVNHGYLGRNTNNPWSFRWGGAAGNLYVGGANDSTFIVATSSDPSSNRCFYVDSTQTITYGDFRPQTTITPAAGVQYRQDNGTNTTVAFMYTRSNTSSATVWSFNNNTGGSPPDGIQRGSIAISATNVAFNTSSDYRLKENIQDFTTSGEIIDALRPVSFDWIGTEESSIGFIAHEVQEVFPEAVTGEKDGDVMQGGDWTKLVPVLVAELKALRARVSELEAQIAGE